jgi:tRNA-splicing ligase RtcB
LPRGEARRAISERRLLDELGDVVVDRRRLAELRDEAPSAYKDVAKVMRAQRALVRQVRRLRPRLVHK